MAVRTPFLPYRHADPLEMTKRQTADHHSKGNKPRHNRHTPWSFRRPVIADVLSREAGQHLVHIGLNQADFRMISPIDKVAFRFQGRLQLMEPPVAAQGREQTVRQKGAGLVLLAVVNDGIGGKRAEQTPGASGQRP